MNVLNQLLLLFFCLVISCSQERVSITDPTFEPYLDEFLLEARKRGFELEEEIEKIKIGFSNLDHAGQCHNRRGEILIDIEYWEHVDEYERKRLVFHELGHCVLSRQHKNEKTISGECISYMRGGEDDFQCSFNLYSEYWRDYYLDELFDSATGLPIWYEEADQYAVQIEDTVYTNDKSFYFDGNIYILDSLSSQISKSSTIKVDLQFTHDLESNLYIVFGDINFSYCPVCIPIKVSIAANGGRTKCFQSNEAIYFSRVTTMSIIKNNDWLKFYLDKRLVHVMEIDLLSFQYEDKVVVRSTEMEEKLPMKFQIITGY